MSVGIRINSHRIWKRTFSSLLLLLFVHKTLSRPNDTARVVLDETDPSADRETFELIEAVTDSSIDSQSISDNKTEKEAFIDDLQFDDVEITNETRSERKCRSDTIFLVDSSSSIHKVFDKQIQYVEKVVDELNVADDGDHVALLVFSGSSRHKMKFSFGEKQHKDLVLSKVRNLPYFGGITAAGAALDHAYLELEKRRQGPHIPSNVVVISDAFSYDTVNNQSENLRQISGVRTFAVCIENGSVSEMRVLAGSEENMLKGFNSHHELARRLQLCNDDDESPQIANSDDNDGGRDEYGGENGLSDGGIPKKSENGKFKNDDDLILKKSHSHKGGKGKKGKSSKTKNETSEAKTNGGGKNRPHAPGSKNNSGNENGDVSGEEGAIGVEPTAVEPVDENSLTGESQPSPKNRPVDVVILLDGSGSLHARFDAQLQMVGQLLEALPQTPISSHISVVKFGGVNRTRILLPLNNPLSNSEIKDVLLSRLQFLGGITYAKEAFEDAIAEFRMSTAKNALKVLVLFSDGFIQDDISDNVKSLHDEDVQVFAAAVTEGNAIDRQQLQLITGNPSNVYTDENYGDLLNKIKTLN